MSSGVHVQVQPWPVSRDVTAAASDAPVEAVTTRAATATMIQPP
jgi:hypothetical protein